MQAGLSKQILYLYKIHLFIIISTTELSISFIRFFMQFCVILCDDYY